MAPRLFTHAFDRRFRTLLMVVAFSAVFGLSFGMYTLWAANMEQGYQPDQPIHFDHSIMAGKHKIDCRYCHTLVDKGPHAGMPTVADCMKCHTEIQTPDAEGNLKLGLRQLLEHWNEKKPIKWVKVHDLADFVYFDHSRHTAAGLDCTECHGDVASMDRVVRVNSLKMGWCLDCHKQPPPAGAPPEQETRAPIHCTTCHR
jgi:hypothetical protein